MKKREEYVFDENYFSFYTLLTTLPKDYDVNDPENIAIFGQRLRYVRETVEERNNQIDRDDNGTHLTGPKYCEIKTAKSLAKALGVTPTTIKDYENGAYGTVPIKYLLDLYDIFGVTPHFLLGLTSDYDKVLSLDKDRNICYKDGKPEELDFPLSYPISLQRQAHNAIGDLMWHDPEKFQILGRLLTANKSVRETGFSILRAYLDNIDAV